MQRRGNTHIECIFVHFFRLFAWLLTGFNFINRILKIIAEGINIIVVKVLFKITALSHINKSHSGFPYFFRNASLARLERDSHLLSYEHKFSIRLEKATTIFLKEVREITNKRGRAAAHSETFILLFLLLLFYYHHHYYIYTIIIILKGMK